MELKPCPFCGSIPKREIRNDILNITCSECVSIGFHNHVNYGTVADTEWNTRATDPLLKEMAEALSRIVEEVKKHAYNPSLEHMGPLVLDSESVLQKYHEQQATRC